MFDFEIFAKKVEAGKNFLSRPDVDAYGADYPVILGWFGQQTTWTADNVRIGGLLVYGWMPTILKTDKTDFSKVAESLNDGSMFKNPTDFLNNSWIGASKFLHFSKPDDFAIWDSRVCRTLGWGGTGNDKRRFDCYQNFCRKFVELHPKMTMRQVEHCLFMQDRIGRANEQN